MKKGPAASTLIKTTKPRQVDLLLDLTGARNV